MSRKQTNPIDPLRRARRANLSELLATKRGGEHLARRGGPYTKRDRQRGRREGREALRGGGSCAV